jgi:hypothetical protein
MPRRPSSGDRAGGLGSAIAKKIDRLSSRQSRHLGVPVGNMLAWNWRRWVVENVRATIIREKQSKIAQQYTLPSRAQCSAMSVHHNSLGRVAMNCRFTRSAGVLTRIRLSRRRPGRGSPHRPFSAMIESTNLRLTFMS